jgi:hypothetical protein
MTLTMTNREKLIGAAWFFNGEGCTNVAIAKRMNGREYATTRIMVANTHLENLEFFQDAVGGLGTIYHNGIPQKLHWKECYSFVASSFEEAQAIIAQLWNWLSKEKREQAYSSFMRTREHRFLHNVSSNARVVRCGTATSYNNGCRCDACVRARQYWDYRSDLRKERKGL